MHKSLFPLQPFESLSANIKHFPGAPTIGISMDWEITGPYEQSEDNSLVKRNNQISYNKIDFDKYVQFIQHSGLNVKIMHYEDDPNEYKDQLDGFLIAGGRDLDPKKYQQEKHPCTKVPREADKRFDFNKRCLEVFPESMPILGICWGFQFLNVAYGARNGFKGSLVQDIRDKALHCKRNTMLVSGGSELNRIFGKKKIIGCCSHHQELDIINDLFEVNLFHKDSGRAHGIELIDENKWVLGILYHPERTLQDESCEELTEESKKLSSRFSEVAKKYRETKISN